MDAVAYMNRVISNEIPVAGLTNGIVPGPQVTDDQPFNEYFLLRRWQAQPEKNDPPNR